MTANIDELDDKAQSFRVMWRKANNYFASLTREYLTTKDQIDCGAYGNDPNTGLPWTMGRFLALKAGLLETQLVDMQLNFHRILASEDRLKLEEVRNQKARERRLAAIQRKADLETARTAADPKTPKSSRQVEILKKRIMELEAQVRKLNEAATSAVNVPTISGMLDTAGKPFRRRRTRANPATDNSADKYNKAFAAVLPIVEAGKAVTREALAKETGCGVASIQRAEREAHGYLRGIRKMTIEKLSIGPHKCEYVCKHCGGAERGGARASSP